MLASDGRKLYLGAITGSPKEPKICDIVLPHVSRFPTLDKNGMPLSIPDEFLGNPAIVLRIERSAVEILSTQTGNTWVYRPDEVTFHCRQEEWQTALAEIA